MADNSNDVFHMLSADDKLDGDNNYPLWTYMMHHVFVSKGVWNIVQGLDVRPGSVDVGSVADVGAPGSSADASSVLQVHATLLVMLLLFYPLLNRLDGMVRMRRLMH